MSEQENKALPDGIEQAHVEGFSIELFHVDIRADGSENYLKDEAGEQTRPKVVVFAEVDSYREKKVHSILSLKILVYWQALC